MAGPLTEVKTTVAGVRLDVKRELSMGAVVTMGLYEPDAAEVGGVGLIRVYTNGFCRIPEAEREIGDGRTVIFDIADSEDYPVGQLQADLKTPDLLLLLTEDGAQTWYSPTDTPKPAGNEAQVYRITCVERTMKQRYMRT